jgi:hypothetical protein
VGTNLRDIFLCPRCSQWISFRATYSFIERGRERRKVGGEVVRDTTVLEGGCNRNIIWQFGKFPGSAR